METFTLEEANFLLNYYFDKIIGKQIANDVQSKIISLEKKLAPNNRFWINCYGTNIESIVPFSSITKVALYLDMLNPTDVLTTI